MADRALAYDKAKMDLKKALALSKPSTPKAPEAASTTSSSPAPTPSNAIAELQEAFGSILLLTREKYKHPIPETIPCWTGTFRLFDFPRELRDLIYHYVLYSPTGVVYRRSPAHIRWPFKEPRRTQLFRVSRQVYHEAQQIFFMETSVKIIYGSHLAGTLRLFPDSAARILQRIHMDYRPDAWRPYDQPRGLSGSWEQILTDSRLAKEFFPMLREFKAIWHVHEPDLERAGLCFDDKTCEERIEIWETWMRKSFQEDRLVAPKWLKMEFVYEHKNRHRDWQMSFNQACAIFGKEAEGQDEALEASGRKWLEEAYGDGRQRKNRKQRRLARMAEA